MVVLAFLANNAGYGLAIGSYASILTMLAGLPGSSLTLASSGVSLLLLSMGLLSPIMGLLVQRVPLRLLMSGGAALCSVAFLLMSSTDHIWLILGYYLLVLGPGVALMGTVPASAVIGMWVAERRGLAMGFVNIPLVMSVTAPIAGAMVVHHGLRWTFLLIAAGYAAMIPLMLLVRNAPISRIKGLRGGSSTTQKPSARYILSQRSFWLIVPTSGAIAGTGVMLTTHIVALGIERGLKVEQAALLLTAYGLSGIPGSFLFGGLADRFGGIRALFALALWLAACWAALAFSSVTGLALTLVLIAMGLGAGGLMGPFLSAVSARFGSGTMMTSVVGMAGLTNTVFIFGLAPIAGFLHDISGTYSIPVMLQLATTLACGALFWVEASSKRHHIPATESP